MESVSADSKLPEQTGGQNKKDDASQQLAADCPARDTKFAENAFGATKHVGLNYIANSALSLGITYNVMPTEPAKKFIDGLENKLKPTVRKYSNFKQKMGWGKALSPEKMEAHLHQSARSTAEILCMCIAGSIILIPMKWMEDHKKELVDKFDKWKNPKYHKYCEDNNLPPAPLPHEEQEKKDNSWGKLISARLIGMASVIGIDAIIQNFNNKRFDANKGNFDTAEWKLGSKLYDILPKSLTERFVNFFSLKKNGIEGIQGDVRTRLEQTVGKDPKRMIFAEQTRFLSKEFSLTAVLAGIMYGLVETGVMGKALDAVGIKKAKDKKKVVDDIVPDLPLVGISEGKSKKLDQEQREEDLEEKKKYTSTIPPRPDRAQVKSENFIERLSNSPSPAASLGV